MFVSLLLFVHSINSSHGWVPPQHRSIPIPSLRRATYLPHVKNSALNMALLPLPVDELEELLVVGPPSGPQYATYWGRTKVS